MARKNDDATDPDGLTRIDPSWPEGDEGDVPLTELTAASQGALSPFGDDLTFPLPTDDLRYEHPTARPAH